ncbi:replication stress response regulator SDE2-like [Patiria miniata]|uniref:Replication stress response regulator SDE2 n=1 Tax=Patiria miniata TaxID=46514 RepID=A0A914BT48_PATMI|nr:replication stress response regulator SDE2-like [Patiria miniata]
MSVFVRMFSGRTLCLQEDICGNNGEKLTQRISELEGIPATFLSIYHHGRKVNQTDVIEPRECYQALLCLKGGKGGFGSMLRMLGAQIDKTTNHDACRDLSGRRMRDVNNEKKLSEWITKKAEKEREREEKRRQKLERLRHEPKHFFVDPNYDKQKQEVIENLDDAITQGIQAAASVSSGASSSGIQSVKRKAEASDMSSKKRSKTLWMGVEEGSDSDDSEDEEEVNTPTASSDSSTSSDSSNSGSSTPIVSRDSPSSSTADREDSEPETKLTVTDKEGSGDSKEGLEEIKTENGKSEGGNSLLNVLPAPTHSENGNTGDGIKADVDQKEEPFNLDSYSSVAELESLGLDTLKSALMERGMKCGGTLQQRAERLYSVKGISLDQIDPSLLAKQNKGKKAKGK